jgi:hypothetical protein
MTDKISEREVAVSSIDAILLGGPAGLPQADRTRVVSADVTRIKIPYLNGYEHFERMPPQDPQPEPAGPVPFWWIMHTRIAE